MTAPITIEYANKTIKLLIQSDYAFQTITSQQHFTFIDPSDTSQQENKPVCTGRTPKQASMKIITKYMAMKGVDHIDQLYVVPCSKSGKPLFSIQDDVYYIDAYPVAGTRKKLDNNMSQNTITIN